MSRFIGKLLLYEETNSIIRQKAVNSIAGPWGAADRYTEPNLENLPKHPKASGSALAEACFHVFYCSCPNPLED